MLENIPKISAMAFEAVRVRMEAPTLAELVPTLRQLKRGNLWLYNSIMNSVDSTVDKLASHLHNIDKKTITDIKNELIWNSLQVVDLVDRALFEKNMQGKMELHGDYSNKNNELNTVDSGTSKRLTR